MIIDHFLFDFEQEVAYCFVLFIFFLLTVYWFIKECNYRFWNNYVTDWW